MLAGEESASTSTAHQSILQIAQEMCVESEGELNVLPLERGYENVILLVFNLAAEAEAGGCGAFGADGRGRGARVR